MKKIIKNYFPFIFIAIVILILLFQKWNHRTRFNSEYVNGNLAGNLYNAGLFCENEGILYFANPDDQNCLYAMDASNGNNLKKISNDNAMYINVDANYIYYVRNNSKSSATDFSFFSYNNNSLCRISKNGGAVTILDPDPCIYASLLGNYLYYLHYDEETATTLYRIKIDGSQKEQVFPYYVFDCSTLGPYFYYNDTTTNGNIYRYDTSNKSSSLILKANAYQPIAQNEDSIFYIDSDRNYSLVHVTPSTNERDILTTDSIDWYNVSDTFVFYQKYEKDNSALYVMNLDGSNPRKLCEGDFCNLSVTSTAFYFTDFHTKQTFYTDIKNPGEILPFSPGFLNH